MSPRTGGRQGVARPLFLFVVISAVAGLLTAGLALPLVGGAGLAARAATESYEGLPSELKTPPLPQRSRILAKDGSTIATFYAENRVSVPLEKVAPEMRQATLAIEDSRFYEHNGIDIRGSLRALATNTEAGGVQQGGSTLTQQYVKNVLIEQATGREEIEAAQAQTAERKLQEMRYAVALEKELTKDEILERYLNIAYFGSGAYGVESASRHYFSKNAAKLTLAEAALLAGIVRSPNAYDPTRNPERSIARRDVVLDRMEDLDMATAKDVAEAKKVPLKKMLKVSPTKNGCMSSYAPFFCDYVTRIILTDPAFGQTPEARRELLERGGLTIRTTLDPKTQKGAQKAVERYVDPKDKAAGAIAMVEPGTGEVQAIAQSRGYGEGRGKTTVNYAVDYQHGNSRGFQAGSTFKVFTLAAAIEKGIPLTTKLSAPPEKTFTGFKNCETGAKFAPYKVRNSTGFGRTDHDVLSGTWQSVNTFYVGLEERITQCAAADMAEKMGVRTAKGDSLGRNPSFTLGTDTVSPLTMANAFATFAARGRYCEPKAILDVTDRDGKKLEVPKSECKQVMDRKVADTVNYVLKGVIDGPDPKRTGARMSLGRPAAGKTGTTNDQVAVWFSGYTPDLAASVWVGGPDSSSYKMRGVTIGGRYWSEACGGCIPGPIWRDAMEVALEGTDHTGFKSPDASLLRKPQSRVPDVTGMTRADATKAIEDAGLRWRIADRPAYSDEPKGRVAGTDPPAGAEVDEGERVTIYLSYGEPAPGGDGGGGVSTPAPTTEKPGRPRETSTP